jgi:uncharacterized protein YndB with AHSA1/START domain
MAEISNQTTETADREIAIARRFDAPRELVWRAWTEPEHLIKWWGPDGFTNTFHEVDFRTGGVWRFIMHGPDGTDYDNYVSFIEVVRPERMVYDQGTSAEHVMHRSMVTFEEVDAGTLVTLSVVFPTPEARNAAVENFNAIEAGNQTLGRLAVYLETL